MVIFTAAQQELLKQSAITDSDKLYKIFAQLNLPDSPERKEALQELLNSCSPEVLTTTLKSLPNDTERLALALSAASFYLKPLSMYSDLTYDYRCIHAVLAGFSEPETRLNYILNAQTTKDGKKHVLIHGFFSENPPHVAIDNLRRILQSLSTDDLKLQLLTMKNSDGEDAIDLAARHHEFLPVILDSISDKNITLMILLRKNASNNETLFYRVTTQNDLRCFKQTLSYIVDDQSRLSALTEKNDDVRRAPNFYTVLNHVVINPLFLRAMLDSFSAGSMKIDLLMEKDSYGDTAFHQAIRRPFIYPGYKDSRAVIHNIFTSLANSGAIASFLHHILDDLESLRAVMEYYDSDNARFLALKERNSQGLSVLDIIMQSKDANLLPSISDCFISKELPFVYGTALHTIRERLQSSTGGVIAFFKDLCCYHAKNELLGLLKSLEKCNDANDVKPLLMEYLSDKTMDRSNRTILFQALLPESGAGDLDIKVAKLAEKWNSMEYAVVPVESSSIS